MNHYYDLYSQHSVAHRPTRPSTAPNRLETEEGPSTIFHSVSDGSETSTVSELEESLDRMRIGASRVQYDSETDETRSYTARSSSVSEEPTDAFQENIRGMVRNTFTLTHPKRFRI